jgi:hypothetical protein
MERGPAAARVLLGWHSEARTREGGKDVFLCYRQTEGHFIGARVQGFGF